MSTASTRAPRIARHPALWFLLALVMAVQSLAVSSIGAVGSTHRHASAEATGRLVDFRRQVHLAAGHLSADRHHHGPRDASVRRTAEDRLADVGEDGSDHAGWQLPPALLGSTPADGPARSAAPRLPAGAWVATWHHPSHPDRPPQRRPAFAST